MASSKSFSATRRGFAGWLAGLGVFAGRGVGEAADDGVALTSNIMVPMRDGVRLATDVYRPARAGKPLEGRFPVLLERTPYGKTIDSRSEISVADPKVLSRAEVARYFVERGYVVVSSECWGRYGSEGEFVKYLSDAHDGYDACAWLVRQPWCDGKIGTMGLSYAAHTQGALACLDPPGVAAMFLDSGGFANAYQDGIRQGGAFELKQVTWAYRAAFESPAVEKDPVKTAALKAIDLKGWFARMPWKRGRSPLSPAPDYEAYVFDQWEAGDFGPFWTQLGIYAEGYYSTFKDAPMVFMSSWYDPYPRSATDNYQALSKLKRGPVKLILGPWTHGDRTLTFAGEVDFGPAATIDGNLAADFLALRLAFFDGWLKGRRTTALTDPPVRIFVMGGGTGRRNAQGRMQHGGRWRAEADWPPPGVRPTVFHLHADGSLSEGAPAAESPPFVYDFDPACPVPSIGGTITSGEPVMRGGAFDQREGPRVFGAREPYRPLAARPDVLVFETAPLEADLEVTGAIEATLFISSDRPDTDFTIKLIDVYPPNPDYPEGFAMNLTDGILRARYRRSWTTPSFLSAGEVAKITVAAFPTSNLFKRGHKIRLDVSSSNFPHFDVNPNTGGPQGRGLVRQTARNSLYVDALRPSHVRLPIIPSDRRV